MVARASAPRVVRRLVIVPDADERVLLMYRLEIGVETVVLVTSTVVVEREDLVCRIERAVHPVLAVAILVDVVAQVHDEIEVGVFGDVPVHVEVPVRVIRAAHHAEAQARGFARRRRLRAASE